MRIGANTDIWQFKQFANKMSDNIVARTSIVEGGLGKRTIKILQATDDHVCSLFRSKTSKRENAYARDLFYNCVSKLFGGSSRIPQSVRDVLTNFGGNNEKPLTARRIRCVVAAIEKLPDPELAMPEVVGLLPPEKAPEKVPEKKEIDPLSDFVDAMKEAEEAYAAEEKELQEEAASGSKSLFASVKGLLGGFSFFGGSKAKPAEDNAPKKPPVKIFSTKMITGSITYNDMPADWKGSEEDFEEVRLRFVNSVEKTLKENGIPERVRVARMQELREALLADDVKGKPLEVNDPNVKKALELASSKDTMYNDSVSTSVINRGMVKVDTTKFLGSLLAQNLLGLKLGSKDALSWSRASVHEGADGYLFLTVRDLKLNDVKDGGWLLGLLKTLLKGKVDQLIIPLKPAYDPESGKISITIGEIRSSNELVENSLSFVKGKLLEKISKSEVAAVRNVELSKAEEDAGCFAKLELNLRRMGSERFVGLNLNESVGANLKDIKFSEKGVELHFGDNVPPPEEDDDLILGFQNDPTKDTRVRPVRSSNASVTIAPVVYDKVLEDALRSKLDFATFEMNTVPKTDHVPGCFEVSLTGVDLSRFADNGNWKIRLARKLGFLSPGNVRLSLRPTLDPVSRRVRLDIVSLTYGDGLKNFLAKKLLPSVLSGILAGKVNGAGVASGPDDSLASISIDPRQVLDKLAIKVPGEIPEISTISVDNNGLSVGVDF